MRWHDPGPLTCLFIYPTLNLIIRLRAAAVDGNCLPKKGRLRFPDCGKKILHTRKEFPRVVINHAAIRSRVRRNAVCLQPQRPCNINRAVQMVFCVTMTTFFA